MKTMVYVYGIGEEVPDKVSYLDAFEVWKSKLATSPASREDTLLRKNDAYFASLGAACTGRTPIASAYAKASGYADCEQRRSAIKEIASATYEADVKAYRAWYAQIVEKLEERR
jgi:hypothetical protein